MMRKLLTLCIALCLMTVVKADTYNYLILEKTDGSNVTLATNGLSMSFSDGNLVANDGTTIALTQLAKMYFSETSAIYDILKNEAQGISIYSIDGMLIGKYKSWKDASQRMLHGGYIIKDAKGNTTKIFVK